MNINLNKHKLCVVIVHSRGVFTYSGDSTLTTVKPSSESVQEQRSPCAPRVTDLSPISGSTQLHTCETDTRTQPPNTGTYRNMGTDSCSEKIIIWPCYVRMFSWTSQSFLILTFIYFLFYLNFHLFVCFPGRTRTSISRVAIKSLLHCFARLSSTVWFKPRSIGAWTHQSIWRWTGASTDPGRPLWWVMSCQSARRTWWRSAGVRRWRPRVKQEPGDARCIFW